MQAHYRIEDCYEPFVFPKDLSTDAYQEQDTRFEAMISLDALAEFQPPFNPVESGISLEPIDAPNSGYTFEELFALFPQEYLGDQPMASPCISPSMLSLQSSDQTPASPSSTSGSTFSLSTHEALSPASTSSFMDHETATALPCPKAAGPSSSMDHTQFLDIPTSFNDTRPLVPVTISPCVLSNRTPNYLQLTNELAVNGFSSKIQYLEPLLQATREANQKKALMQPSGEANNGQVLENYHFLPFFEKRGSSTGNKNQNRYYCSFCEYSIPNRTQVIQHIMGNHLKYFPFWCDKCEKSFVRPADLKKHVEDRHSTQTHYCECSKAYTNARNLARHQKRKCRLQVSQRASRPQRCVKTSGDRHSSEADSYMSR